VRPKPKERKAFFEGGYEKESLEPAALAIFIARECWLFCFLNSEKKLMGRIDYRASSL
jgi:hypothetical protein